MPYSILRFPATAVSLAEALANEGLRLVDPGVSPSIDDYSPDPSFWGDWERRIAVLHRCAVLKRNQEYAKLLLEATNISFLLNFVVSVNEPMIFDKRSGAPPKSIDAVLVTERFLTEWISRHAG